MTDTPFDTIESAHEYLRLLAWQVDDVQKAIEGEVEEAVSAAATRRVDALRVVDYKLKQLGQHLEASRRILNDLRMLRRLLVGDWDEAHREGGESGEQPARRGKKPESAARSASSLRTES